jgi:hypothetical protein
MTSYSILRMSKAAGAGEDLRGVASDVAYMGRNSEKSEARRAKAFPAMQKAPGPGGLDALRATLRRF